MSTSFVKMGTRISNSIKKGFYSRAAYEHPLFFSFSKYTSSAMDRVGRMKLYNDTPFVTALPHINGNTGSVIGTMFEYNLLQVINEDFSEFRAQRKRSECDIVCQYDRILDFEIKTTSATNAIYGNKVMSQSKDGGFLLAVNYDKHSLEVKKVRFGWSERDGWIRQNGNGQQSRLNKDSLNVRLQYC